MSFKPLLAGPMGEPTGLPKFAQALAYPDARDGHAAAHLVGPEPGFEGALHHTARGGLGPYTSTRLENIHLSLVTDISPKRTLCC
jgi:hypothetical protein